MNIFQNKFFGALAGALLAIATLASCSDDKSYSDLLNDENRTVNLFLSQHRLVNHLPENNEFEVGPDAPYYCIDDEGNVYMQVLDKGTDVLPEEDDRVYFRYIRYNLQYYVVGSNTNMGVGNALNMTSDPTFFLFKNLSVEESTQYGTGIQEPMKYLGYDCKVNLVVKSQAGPIADISYVVPYLYTISYYKPAL